MFINSPALILLLLQPLTQLLVPAQPRSVCEVLDQMVLGRDGPASVRGQLIRTDHGDFLRDPKCNSPIKLDGQDFERLIYLALPGSWLLKKPVPFTLDSAEFSSVLDAAERNGGNIWVVVSGRLEAFPYGKVTKAGKTMFVGFGPQNASPAQLVIQNIAVAAPPAK